MFGASANANFVQQQDCEALPIQVMASGASLTGNVDATAIAGLSLKAKAFAVYTDPIAGEGSNIGTANAFFQDRFRFLVPGTTGFAFLDFTLNLTGLITTVGMASEGSVAATLSLGDQFFFNAFERLTAPGTVVLPLEVVRGVESFIDAQGTLAVEGDVNAPGNVTIDFLDTFDVTKIQLFDTNGNLLADNIVLTDDAGNTLGGPPNPPPAVPEPSSVLLLAVAWLGFLTVSKWRERHLKDESRAHMKGAGIKMGAPC